MKAHLDTVPETITLGNFDDLHLTFSAQARGARNRQIYVLGHACSGLSSILRFLSHELGLVLDLKSSEMNMLTREAVRVLRTYGCAVVGVQYSCADALPPPFHLMEGQVLQIVPGHGAYSRSTSNRTSIRTPESEFISKAMEFDRTINSLLQRGVKDYTAIAITANMQYSDIAFHISQAARGKEKLASMPGSEAAIRAGLGCPSCMNHRR